MFLKYFNVTFIFILIILGVCSIIKPNDNLNNDKNYQQNDLVIIFENDRSRIHTMLRFIDMHTIEVIELSSWQHRSNLGSLNWNEFLWIYDFKTHFQQSFVTSIFDSNINKIEIFEISSEKSKKLCNLLNNVKETEANVYFEHIRYIMGHLNHVYIIIDGYFYWSIYDHDINENFMRYWNDFERYFNRELLLFVYELIDLSPFPIEGFITPSSLNN